MVITGSFKINTEAEEKEVFDAFKQFMIEQFQEFEFAVSGKKETLRHKQDRAELKKEKKEELVEAKTTQAVLG